ncbi:hypothetical protein [Pseudoflavitalea rhizosphaerae]|uniref:hypothetical protein n=1 Tax=Pseudoflavitalea rhizosphaerae TaxID=1884793 RepID=UPI000F8D3FE1|nr:hypothetical protein [Pseudoflavitalea rhizosphaerae]
MEFNEDEHTSNKKLKFRLFKPEERNYWKNFEINIDAFCDKWGMYKSELEKEIKGFSEEQLKKICFLLEVTPKVTESDFEETLLGALEKSILFFCITKFASVNPKAISRHYNIRINGGKVDRPKVFIKTLEIYKSGKLSELYLLLFMQRVGKAKYSFDVVAQKGILSFEAARKSAELLVRYLNRNDKEGKEYHLRFSEKINRDFVFLLLRETSDKIVASLPDNTRVKYGRYLLVRIEGTGKLSINTKIHQEAARIKNYLARKTKSSIKYNKEYATYDSKKFFDSILEEKSISKDVTLLNVTFRKTVMGEQELKVSDKLKKNDITHVIRLMRDKGILKLTDFSEFQTLTFSFKGVSFIIQIRENQWGQLRLVVLDQRKPANELRDFKQAFSRAYDIPFDAFLKSKDVVTDKMTITRKILDNKTLSPDMPEDVESVFLDLINNNFIKKPVTSAKRKCEECRHVYWQKGDCPNCGNQAFFEGDYIDVEIDEMHFGDHLYKSIKADKSLTVKKVKRQINRHSFPFIEVINKNGDLLSIYTSKSNIPLAVTEHFEENGKPLLIVLLKYKQAVQAEIAEKNFECADFVEIINKDKRFLSELVKTSIDAQKKKWQAKVIQKATLSFNRIRSKGANYGDQFFEKDIYNLLHVLFPIADRLGGKFAGVKAPDGIISIQDYGKPRKRFCFGWDCKFSLFTKGYQLNDKPEKHKHYLSTLSKNETVTFFGGFKVYAFISQNMDESRYAKFYRKLIARARWKGHILLLTESNVLLLYTVYKNNEELIKSYPNLFYRKIFTLISKPWLAESEPYKYISNERIMQTMDDLQAQFKKVHKRFNFKRSDF